jgi:hypothetical protein
MGNYDKNAHIFSPKLRNTLFYQKMRVFSIKNQKKIGKVRTGHQNE